MDYLEIEGGVRLGGRVEISGAKNAALPLLALCLLAKNQVRLSNLPEVADISTFIKLLGMLGAGVVKEAPHSYTIDTSKIHSTKAVYDIVRKMRASILVLGPLLSRFGYCEVSLPGGCAIGARPIDLHIRALEQLGASLELKSGYVVAKAEGGLRGADIVFDLSLIHISEPTRPHD